MVNNQNFVGDRIGGRHSNSPRFSRSFFIILLCLLFKVHADESMVLVLLSAGYDPIILSVEVDCLMISLKCFKSNLRMASTE